MNKTRQKKTRDWVRFTGFKLQDNPRKMIKKLKTQTGVISIKPTNLWNCILNN